MGAITRGETSSVNSISCWDYVPFASTVTSLHKLFQRCTSTEKTEPKSREYGLLSPDSILRYIVLLFPIIGNIIVAIYDLCCAPKQDALPITTPKISIEEEGQKILGGVIESARMHATESSGIQRTAEDMAPATGERLALWNECQKSSPDLAKVRALLAKIPDLNYTNVGTTPFGVACEKGHREIVAMMLQRVDVNRPDLYGITPFMHACGSGNSGLVTDLMSAGANHLAELKNGMNALFYAAVSNNPAIIQYLEAIGLDVNKKLSNGTALLTFALLCGHMESAHYLLSKSSTDLSCLNTDQIHLYHTCCNDERVARAVLRACPPTPETFNRLNNSGFTPLQSALLAGNEVVAMLYLDYGADPKMKSPQGTPALEIARALKLSNVAKRIERMMD